MPWSPVPLPHRHFLHASPSAHIVAESGNGSNKGRSSSSSSSSSKEPEQPEHHFPSRHVELKQTINELSRKKYVLPRHMARVVQYMEKHRSVFLEARVVSRVRLLLQRLTAGEVGDYNVVMNALAEMGLREDCFNVFARMRNNLIKPDTETLNCLVLASVRDGRTQDIDDVVAHFKKTFNVKPNARTFAHRISEFDKKKEGRRGSSGSAGGRKEEVKQAIQLLEAMKLEKPPIRPNLEVINSLIAVCVRHYDMKTAGILFRDIERGNLKPDRRSYDLMLRGFEIEADAKIIQKMIKEMQRAQVEPDASAYGHLIGAYGRAEQEERALQAFEDVKANHPDVALDAAIYGKVLDVLAGKWKEEDDYQIDDLWMANATRDGREGEVDEDWDREWTDEWEGAGNVEQMALFEEQEAERRREEMRKKEEDRLRREAEEREREEREEEERKQKEREEREMSEMEKQRRREANAQYVDKAFALLEDMSRGRNIDPDYATFFKLMSLCLKRDNTTRALQVFDLFKREAERHKQHRDEAQWTGMEMQSVAKLLALKFVRGCEKNRDMQALETFLTKHPHYIVPGDIYSAVVKAIANAYVPPLRKPTETDEERGWIDSLESGDHPSTRDGGGVAEKGENKRQQQGEKGDWLYTQAWALFHEMPRHGIARSKDVYDAMIELACKRASIKRALALFREMQHEAEREQRESGKTTLKPGLRTYRSLIVHCLNNNYFNKEEEYNYRNDINHPLTQRAFQLFEEMEDARIKPDLKVINAMLGCCARVEDKANGLKLLGLLVRSNLVADDQTLKFKDRIQKL